MKTSLSSYVEQIYRCGRCGYCIGGFLEEICPSRFLAKFEASTGRGRMLVARAILEDKLEYSSPLAERLYNCFLCAACDLKCEMAAKIKITEITRAMRNEISSARLEPKRLSELGSAIMRRHNIYGAPIEERAAWIPPNIAIQAKTEILYFPGCVVSYRLPQAAQSTAKILHRMGVKFTILGKEEWCCGDPLFSMGKTELAREVVTHNVAKIRDRGFREVLTSCAGCYRAMTQEYPKLLGEKLPFEVTHTTQFFRRLIEKKEIRMTTARQERVTYHDPCEIGRHCNIYEEPREIIHNIPGIDLVEMERNREDAWCCGGGGSVSAVFPRLALKVAHERIREAQRTGATTIATACPSCVLMLDLANKRMGAKLRVIDISELVAQAMQLN